MAQNNGLIIGIIALLVIGGVAWYFLNNQQPTPGITTASFTDGFTQIQAAHSFSFQQMDESYFITMLELTPAEQQATMQKIKTIHDTLLPQSNENAYHLSQLTAIILSVLEASQSRNQLITYSNEIIALPLEQYCNNLSLFEQRNQAGEAVLQRLTQASNQINTFVQSNPTQAVQISLSNQSLQYDAFAQDVQEAYATTQSLQETCTGGI